ncbi:hypothetical protein MmiAt1_17550 [Methanimicrococcus sp. At1]|uniref:DUF1638 domain-containing protein n=1 Tax=Methanimicrococcus hacksteinii TaxID=3028293 RepID=A0ABU3VRV7_9EURY|nr:DUF1638 domain-containing protein [Methanimicrococcus sp. At1]MDV0446138.1 hypothetical protein [Methanimicrococcus sp. At1]
MPVIGILNCKMLQDEIVYLIQNDSDIQNVTVIENGQHDEFIKKLNQAGLKYSLAGSYDLLPDAAPVQKGNTDISLVVWNMELGLHDVPKILKEEVYENLHRFAPKVNGILLFYGLCGNVLAHVEDDFKDIVPVVILREADGEIVDDCVGATIGGRTPYLNLLKSFHGVGTLILTPMGAATTNEFFSYKKSLRPLSEDEIYQMNKFMFDEANYKRVARLETGLHYTEDADDSLHQFADKYHFEVIDLDGGSQKIFENSYLKLKNIISEVV